MKGMKKFNLRNHIKLIQLIIIELFIFVCLFSFFGLLWVKQNFANISLEEIVMTLGMPLEGTNSGYFLSFFLKVILPAVGIWLFLFLLFYFPARKELFLETTINKKKYRLKLFPLVMNEFIMGILLTFSMIMILLDVERTYQVTSFLANRMENSAFIENEYVDPNEVNLVFPERKRNLIWIILESGESSNQDTANGGLFNVNYIPELTELARNNVSFSQSSLLQGAVVSPLSAGTIAGLVSQNSGVPLIENIKNQQFLPGLTTLGDVISDNDYHTYFMCGSDFAFGGRKMFFTQHGDYEYFDYYTAIDESKIPNDYKVWWGFEDSKLYSYAKEKITEFSTEDQPFAVTLLTVDTHATGGYICELCGSEYDRDYANVWACASRQVYDFVAWIQEQDFYENTTIVITGDHISMDAAFYPTAPSGTGIEGSRRVYNVFINSAVSAAATQNRRFTTLDMFPTVVASMGIQIPGERLGLGTNLFSQTETLSEQYGYDYLFEQLRKQSNFYYNKFIMNQ